VWTLSSSFRKFFQRDEDAEAREPMDLEFATGIRVEALEHVERLGAQCVNLLMASQNDIELGKDDIDELFRSLHSLKSLAAMADLAPMERLMHVVEDGVSLFRKGQLVFSIQHVHALSDLQHLTEVFFSHFPESKTFGPEFFEAAKGVQDVFLQKNATQESKHTATPSNAFTHEVSDVELEAFEKYQPRSERLFAISFHENLFGNVDELLQSQHIDNISRVGDVIFSRVDGPRALVLFTAELDQEILEEIAQAPIIELEKQPACLKNLGKPWETITFERPETRFTREAMSPVKQAPKIPVQAPKEEVEDFDGANKLQSANSQPGLDADMLQDFLSNAEDLLESLSQSMLELEQNPGSEDAIESIFRSAHTIKGTAAMFDFRAMVRLTHIMENLFDRIRKGHETVTPVLMDGLLFAFDRIKEMFECLKLGKSAEISINDALAKLENKEPVTSNERVNSSHKSSAALPDDPPHADRSQAAQAAVPKEKGKPGTPSAEALAASNHKLSSEGSGTIRVDLKRLDSLVNLVGELVIDRTRFARIEEEIRGRAPNSELASVMSESVLLFGRHMNEVQSIIMKIRMVPIGNAFSKFVRVVRDLSRQCEKEVELVIEGGETELDKTLVEEIGDPLIHLIRNSVDHGIELPAERIANGKSPRGKIRLSAMQDGNMIVITVQDDGKGLQVDRIRAKALSQGLIKDAEALADKEIYNLIFEPGFSTAEAVTNISGRGVGMDVVKKNIVKLKGVVEVDSVLGRGTTLTIKLPLTLAIIPSLMVENLGESYAIPLVNVIESIRIKPDEIQKIGAADFVKLRGQVLPLLRLSDVFELHQMEKRLWYRTDGSETKGRSLGQEAALKNGKSSSVLAGTSATSVARRRKQRLIFVVVGVGEQRVGLIVDQLLGQQEIVIKSLGRMMGKLQGVAGGCVLGNGCVALVLDVGEIIDDFNHSKGTFNGRAVG
jgi:two-component system chemotaxis sensor kinase CheA